MESGSTISSRKPNAPHEQRPQMGSMPSLPPMTSMSPKVKLRTLTDHDTHPSPSDQTFPASILPGMLPPLSIKGDMDADTSKHSPPSGPSRRRINADKDSQNSSDPRPLGISLKTAALAVLSAETMRDYRRSSAAMHIELLRVFVPDMLIKYLENAAKPLESQAFFVKAACMCADISGFTALSEKHCKKGTAGLDTLVQIINSYYSNLVNIVYSFGGDIIKIAGDALYCVFMPDEHDLRGAVLCAALCSMQLREVAADGLTLHVGISCGELCFGILGGIDNYWECLMSGEPIGLVADALDEAKKQEVVVSVECMSIIGDCCRGTPLPSRNVLLNSLEPPRREKRGSVRMANMIANKGLPVKLEPMEGLFAGTEAVTAAAAAAAVIAASQAAEAAGGTTTVDGELGRATAMGDATTSTVRGEAGAGGSTGKPSAAGVVGGVVDASAAWVSSNAKAKRKGAEPELGAAGKMRAEVSSEVLPMLQGFVPGPVTDLLAAGIFMYMAEMRTVTTLFVKLDSYSPDKHKNLLSLQIHLTTIQKILAEHEGFLRQFLVDDKGCVMIACWGVPGRSYSDNGNRCLAAAVEIHASLSVRDMKTSMGITTGHALCGRMGGKIRSEYAMVGDVINLAARLMGKAKGRIVCDEATHDLVCSNETMVALFKRLDPMMLKGKEYPIAPFVCLAQQGSDMWETHKQLRMIGRAKLQNSVNAFLDAIDKGDNVNSPEPAVVVIEGAHGTGKSMFADRVKKSASQFFRRKVHMYAMVQTHSSTAYAGAKGMLRTIFGLDHLGDDALAIKKSLLKIVREVYGSAEHATMEVAVRALRAVLGVDVGGETEGEILQDVRRSSVGGRLPTHVVHSVISEMATHALGALPAVFILDNVHLMDKMSWKLLIQLLYCPLRLLLVLTATPVEEDIKKRRNLLHAKKKSQFSNLAAAKAERSTEGLNLVWHGDHGETHLHMQQYIRATQLPITTKFTLSPFTKEEVRQLIQHTLAPQDRAGNTETLVNTVYGLTGGNPYWCVEVGRFIKDNSVEIFMNRIAVEASGGITTGRSAVSTPEEAMMGRMGILVVCRFERLLVEEQSVMRYASVAGLEFSMDLLHTVLPRNIRPQLELLLQALVSARFVVYSRHTYYKFRNSMVHMVLYNLTPASSRKRIHKAIADYYVIGHGDDPLYLPVTTYHLLQARVEPEQAFKFVCKTAAHALVALCYNDCMEALEKAVEFASCTSEIHTVLFVHHYISSMHELGHTTVRGDDLGSRAEEEAHRGSSDGKNDTGDDSVGNDAKRNAVFTVGRKNDIESNSRCNSNNGGGLGRAGENCTVHNSNSEDSWRMGKGGSKARSSGEQEREGHGSSGRRKFSFHRRTVDERSLSSREETASINAGHTSLAAIEAQTQVLGERIARFKTLTREPHARLCSAGQFCPTLRGTFPSPRQQAADDDLTDSLRSHPAPIPAVSVGQTSATAAEGACDFFEEPVETEEYVASAKAEDKLGDQTSEGSSNQHEGNDRSARSGSPRTPTSDQVARSGLGLSHRPGQDGSRTELPHTEANFIVHTGDIYGIPGSDGDHQASSRLHTSLGWELAHLLHVCLGRYLEPGGPSPGNSRDILGLPLHLPLPNFLRCNCNCTFSDKGHPEMAHGSFSLSIHRLPGEDGGGIELEGQGSDDEEVSRRASYEHLHERGSREPNPGTERIRRLRSKVSSAKLLIAEHGPRKHLQPGVSLQASASSVGQSISQKLGQAISGLRQSAAERSPGLTSNRTKSYSTNGEVNANNNQCTTSEDEGPGRWPTPMLARKSYFARRAGPDRKNKMGVLPAVIQAKGAENVHAEGQTAIHQQGDMTPTRAGEAPAVAVDVAASVVFGKSPPKKEHADEGGRGEGQVVVRNVKSHARSSVCVVS